MHTHISLAHDRYSGIQITLLHADCCAFSLGLTCFWYMSEISIVIGPHTIMCNLLNMACRLKHHGHGNAVHLNDVFFAVHAALLAGLTLIQCFIYEKGNQRVSKLCASAIGFTVTASCVSFLLVLFDNRKYPFLTFLYWLSWVKMGVTFFKYMPQVIVSLTA